jgi:hypothetical protein
MVVLIPLLVFVADVPAWAATCYSYYFNHGNAGHYYAGEVMLSCYCHAGLYDWQTPYSQTDPAGSNSFLINYLDLGIANETNCGGMGCWVQGGFGQGVVGGYPDGYGPGALYMEFSGYPGGDYWVDWASPGYVSPAFFEAPICSSQPYLAPPGVTVYACSDCIYGGSAGAFCDQAYLPTWSGNQTGAATEAFQDVSGACGTVSGADFGQIEGSYSSSTIIYASQDGTNFHGIYGWTEWGDDYPYAYFPVSPDGEQAFSTQT